MVRAGPGDSIHPTVRGGKTAKQGQIRNSRKTTASDRARRQAAVPAHRDPRCQHCRIGRADAEQAGASAPEQGLQQASQTAESRERLFFQDELI